MFSPRFRKGSRPRSGRGQPFVGYAEMWKAWVSQATCYGEYGVGDSTIWAGRFTQSPIVAVDTSLQWIQYVRDGVGERPDQVISRRITDHDLLKKDREQQRIDDERERLVRDIEGNPRPELALAGQAA